MIVLIAAIVLLKYVTGNSSGAPVPNVLNDTLPVAEQAITSAGLKVGTVTPRSKSASVAKGLVISTSPGLRPDASRRAAPSTSSTPPARSRWRRSWCPSVVGEPRGKAVAALRAAGFQVAVIAGQSATAPPNTVVSQTPAGNSNQPVGSTVTISVTGAAVTVPHERDRHERRRKPWRSCRPRPTATW